MKRERAVEISLWIVGLCVATIAGALVMANFGMEYGPRMECRDCQRDDPVVWEGADFDYRVTAMQDIVYFTCRDCALDGLLAGPPSDTLIRIGDVEPDPHKHLDLRSSVQDAFDKHVKLHSEINDVWEKNDDALERIQKLEDSLDPHKHSELKGEQMDEVLSLESLGKGMIGPMDQVITLEAILPDEPYLILIEDGTNIIKKGRTP